MVTVFGFSLYAFGQRFYLDLWLAFPKFFEKFPYCSPSFQTGNEEFAKGTPFRRRIAHGFGVFSMASGLGVQVPPVRTIALFGVRYWKFVLPVFIGDTIRVRTKLVEKTLRGIGKRGEVVWHREILNQEGKVVQEGEIVTLVECRPLVRTPKVAESEPASVNSGTSV